MTSVRTIAYEVVGDLCVLVHSEEQPSSADWTDYLAFLREKASPVSPRCLVVTDGVAPTPTQRAGLNDLVIAFGKPVPTAVITHSPVARAAVALLGWFNSGIRSFSPNELSSALSFLDIEQARRAEVLERVIRMRIEMSGTSEQEQGNAAVDLRQIADDMESLMLKRLPALRELTKR
jgi:hypothetical protein